MGNDVSEALFGRHKTATELVMDQRVENMMTCSKLNVIKTRFETEVSKRKQALEHDVEQVVDNNHRVRSEELILAEVAEIRSLEGQILQLTASISSVQKMNNQLIRGEASKEMLRTMWKTQRLMRKCRITGPSEKTVNEIIRQYAGESEKLATRETKMQNGLEIAAEMGESSASSSLASESDRQYLADMIDAARQRKQQQLEAVQLSQFPPAPDHQPGGHQLQQQQQQQNNARDELQQQQQQ